VGTLDGEGSPQNRFFDSLVGRLVFMSRVTIWSYLVIDQFAINLPIIIRTCRENDLSDLEWFGLLTEYRQTIRNAFQRYQKGEIIMLIAEADHFPIGQLWIDLTKRREQSIGFLWSLRVFIPFQNLGIGTRLIASAEQQLKAQRFRISELSVEKDNSRAQRLYQRLGYQIVRDNLEVWEYTPPNGTPVQVRSDVWILHKFLVDDGTVHR